MGENNRMDEDYVNSAMLIWQEGEIIREQWTLEGDEVLIGRDESCHIQIANRWISRIHARIWQEGTQFLLEDANSKNGLYVNAERVIKSYALNDGDVLQLAPGLDLVFVDSEATAPLPGRAASQLRLDFDERQVYINGKIVSPALSNQQFQILALLSDQPGKVYSRHEVIEAAWPDDHVDGVSDDAVDAMIRRLRQRMTSIDPDQEYIVTVRGYGFKLNLK